MPSFGSSKSSLFPLAFLIGSVILVVTTVALGAWLDGKTGRPVAAPVWQARRAGWAAPAGGPAARGPRAPDEGLPPLPARRDAGDRAP